MKQTILFISFFFILSVATGFAQCCNKKVKECETAVVAASVATNDVPAIKAYYFHATRRCATCQAVESVTQEALKEYYGTEIPFQSINREEDSKNPLLEKYKVSGQTLLIIKGDKVVNLTNEAFLNARTNPAKFKAKLKSTIDSI